jgi:hypothetical protein
MGSVDVHAGGIYLAEKRIPGCGIHPMREARGMIGKDTRVTAHEFPTIPTYGAVIIVRLGCACSSSRSSGRAGDFGTSLRLDAPFFRSCGVCMHGEIQVRNEGKNTTHMMTTMRCRMKQHSGDTKITNNFQ